MTCIRLAFAAFTYVHQGPSGRRLYQEMAKLVDPAGKVPAMERFKRENRKKNIPLTDPHALLKTAADAFVLARTA